MTVEEEAQLGILTMAACSMVLRPMVGLAVLGPEIGLVPGKVITTILGVVVDVVVESSSENLRSVHE